MSRILRNPGFWFTIGVVIYLGAAAKVVLAADLDKMQEQMFGVTVQIDASCSGTIVHSARDDASGDVSTLVLSAKHCVNDVDREYRVNVPVYQKNRIVKVESFVARVKGQDWKSDLALFELKDKQTWFDKVAAIGEEDAALFMGESVWTVGYPMGRELTVTTGSFTSAAVINSPKSGIEYYRATPSVIGGSSGGGLYRMEGDGFALIGVVSRGYLGAPWVSYYVTREDIYAYLKVSAPQVIGINPKPKAKASH